MALNDFLEDSDDVLAAIHSLMGMLRGMLPSKRFCKIIPLALQTRKATRQGSSRHTLERFIQLKDFLSQLDSTAIDDCCLPPSENR